MLIILSDAFVAFYRVRRELERVSPETRRQLLDDIDAMITEGMETLRGFVEGVEELKTMRFFEQVPKSASQTLGGPNAGTDIDEPDAQDLRAAIMELRQLYTPSEPYSFRAARNVLKRSARDRNSPLRDAALADLDALARAEKDADTSADAITPDTIKENKATVLQVFRFRVNDSGNNGVRGDSDDRTFATQGIYIPSSALDDALASRESVREVGPEHQREAGEDQRSPYGDHSDECQGTGEGERRMVATYQSP